MTNFPPIFLLRHGQTEWNLAQRLQGSQDSPLTVLGQNQALIQNRLLASVLDRFECDAVVSPLGRTRQTAEIALKGHTLNSPLRVDARIAEINAGAWEGLERQEISRRWPDSKKAACDFEFYTQAVGGEGLEHLRVRCAEFLDELIAPTILVTHGICSVMLRAILCKLDTKEMYALPLTQGCIFEIWDGREEILQEAK